jgi:hypothetical protein
MAARTAGRKGRPFVRAQRQCFAEETHCYFCGNYVDQDFPDPRHSLARSVHHLIPPDVEPGLANARENLRLAHLGCNSSHGRGVFRRGSSAGVPQRGAATWGHAQGRTHRGGRHTRVVRAGGLALARPDRDW